jgi:hypothetical protein
MNMDRYKYLERMFEKLTARHGEEEQKLTDGEVGLRQNH